MKGARHPDAFGPGSVVTPPVAKLDGVDFLSPATARMSWVPTNVPPDIFVTPGERGRRVDHTFMATVAAGAIRRASVSVEWTAHTTNVGVLAFRCRRTSAAEARIMSVNSERLRTPAGV